MKYEKKRIQNDKWRMWSETRIKTPENLNFRVCVVVLFRFNNTNTKKYIFLFPKLVFISFIVASTILFGILSICSSNFDRGINDYLRSWKHRNHTKNWRSEINRRNSLKITNSKAEINRWIYGKKMYKYFLPAVQIWKQQFTIKW